MVLFALQWNCQGYRAKYTDLIGLIREYSPLCVCLQETMLGDYTPTAPRGYTLLKSSTHNQPIPGNGLAMLVHSSQSWQLLNINTPLQVMACQMGREQFCTICNIYINQDNNTIYADLNNLLQQLPRPFIIMGDFNSHNTLWGDPGIDPAGRDIERIILNNDIGLLNTGSHTHYHKQTNTTTAIDLTMVPTNIIADYEWKVDRDLYGSDHFPIHIKYLHATEVRRPPSYILNAADWRTFKLLTEINFPYHNNTCEQNLHIFNTTVQSAADVSIPVSSENVYRKHVPWWTTECTRVNLERKQALRRYQRTGLVCDKISLNRATAIAKRTKNVAKRDSWQRYVSSLNSKTPMTKIWERIRKINGKYNSHHPPVLTDGGVTVGNPRQTTEILARYFESVSQDGYYSQEFIRIKRRDESQLLDFSTNINIPYNEPITMREINNVLKSCKNTAPGEDQIVYPMIRQLHPTAVEFLLYIYNQVWLGNYYPNQWQRAVVLAFHKPGKSTNLPSSYRPIALTSTVAKLLEKIVNIRLMNYLEYNRLLSPYQFGFRKMRSSQDALMRFTSDVSEAILRGDHAVGIFFDMEKAYDRTWRYGILRKIHSLNIRGEMAFYIANFLRNRYFKTKINDQVSSDHIQKEGVPQGSVLSCTLFALAIDDITENLPHDVHCQLYVDDFVLYSSSTYLPALERRLQRAIDMALGWATAHGFSFSRSKTKGILFTRRRRHPEPLLRLGNENISFYPTAKLLGLTFDKKLSWKPHIENLKKSCMKRLSILRCVSHYTWGADRLTLLRLYRSLIRSKLDYASVIYNRAKENVLSQLDPVNNEALRICTGAFKSSPIDSLHAESGEMPLKLRRTLLSLQFFVHIEALPTSPTYASIHTVALGNAHPDTFAGHIHSIITNANIQNINVTPMSATDTPIWNIKDEVFCFEGKYGAKRDNSSDGLRQLFFEHANNYHNNGNYLYTDGSCTDAGVDCAVVGIGQQVVRKLPDCATIFTAELTAIRDALRLIETSNRDQCTIFSDSQSALQAISKYNSNHPLVMEILNWL